MSDTWTNGVCIRCRKPVPVEGSPERGFDYRLRCPDGHFVEDVGDTDLGDVWWCVDPNDKRTEAEVLADIEWTRWCAEEAKAALARGDRERFAELTRMDMARKGIVER